MTAHTAPSDLPSSMRPISLFRTRSPVMRSSKNRLVQRDLDAKFAAATRKFLAAIPSLPVGGKMLTPEQVAETFDARVASNDAAKAAAAARAAAVKVDRDTRSQT